MKSDYLFPMKSDYLFPMKSDYSLSMKSDYLFAMKSDYLFPTFKLISVQFQYLYLFNNFVPTASILCLVSYLFLLRYSSM